MGGTGFGASWEAVEDALRRGWRVFPLWGLVESERGLSCACPEGEGCRQKPGKHPVMRGGFTTARGLADGAEAVMELAQWWARGGGRYNLGVRTGGAVAGSGGLIVVDVDVRAGGLESLEAHNWETATGLDVRVLDGALRVDSGRGDGGGHWYLRWDPEWLSLGRVVSGKNGVLPGVDIKSDGGYVVGVGSRHVAGGWYQWLPGREAWPEGGGGVASGAFMSWVRDSRGGVVARRGGGGAGAGGGTAGVAGYSFREVRTGTAGAGAGMRDQYFNDLAFRLRVGGMVSWERAVAEMRAEWERTEQPAGDEYPWEMALGKLERVWRTVEVGAGEGAGSVPLKEVPVPVPGADAGAGLPPLGFGLPEVLPEGGGQEEATDTGNGLRYARLFRGKALHSRKLGEWFLWDSGRGAWMADEKGQTLEWTKSVVADIRADAHVARINQDNDSATLWTKWAFASSSMAKRSAMLSSAAVEEGLAVTADELDVDPWLFALSDGVTLDLRSVEIGGPGRPGSGGAGAELRRWSRPEDLITRVAGVAWADVEAAWARYPGVGAGAGAGWRGGLWESHVLRMVRGDREAAAWLRRSVGYCLTGSVREQTLTFLNSDGESGKNVFLETLLAVWGGYGIKAQGNLLTAGDDEHPVGLFGLRGARLVFVDEVGKKRLNETRLKEITGGAVQRARDIGGKWIEFPMLAKVWVSCNGLPQIRDNSHGMWRRVRVAELLGKVGQDGWVREPGFLERLLAECRGEVLAWALEGLREWHATGQGTYPDMDASAAVYREEEDLFGLFMEECLFVDPACEPLSGGAGGGGGVAGGGVVGSGGEGDWTDQRALYSRYQMWCALSQDRRERLLDISHFGRELRKRVPGLVVARERVSGERVRKVYGVFLREAVR